MDEKMDRQSFGVSSGPISRCPTNLRTHSDYPHPWWDPVMCDSGGNNTLLSSLHIYQLGALLQSVASQVCRICCFLESTACTLTVLKALRCICWKDFEDLYSISLMFCLTGCSKQRWLKYGRPDFYSQWVGKIQPNKQIKWGFPK